MSQKMKRNRLKTKEPRHITPAPKKQEEVGRIGQVEQMSMAGNPVSTSVRFKHTQSSQFRIVHVDGFYGGPTPTGLLFTNVYTLLPPLPTEILQEVMANGVLGKELSRQVEAAIERRFEVGLLMDASVTRALRDWLSQQLEVLESIHKEVRK